MPLTRTDLEAAALRLRGQIVRTPIVGGLVLPERLAKPGLRVAIERLQPGGSLRFRGALHTGLRRFGARKGVVLAGDASERSGDELVAQAVAAHVQRTPLRAVVCGELAARTARLLTVLDCIVERFPSVAARDERVDQIRGEEGLELPVTADSPGLSGADYQLGIATLAIELEDALAEDVRTVLCADSGLAGMLQAGLDALDSGRRARVPASGITADRSPADESIRAAFVDALRVDLSDTDVHLLAAAPVVEPSCVVLGS